MFIRPASGKGGVVQVTPDGGAAPVWVGRELFFVRRGTVHVLDVSTEPALQAGASKVLFEGRST